MKKILKFISFLIVLMVILGIFLCYYFMMPVSKKSNKVMFNITAGASSVSIIKDLKKNDLIKNEKFALLFLKLNKIGSIKAGNFELNKNMSLREIFEILTDSGKIKREIFTLTFKEGINMRGIVNTIVKNTDIKEEDIYNLLSDKEYIDSLIKDYWYLDNIILDDNIYYPLEGYLYPDTYEFNKDASIKDIFKRLLDQEKNVLDKYKKDIENSKFSVHELVTLASISELEGKTIEDRKNIIGVFINRLNNNIPLGSDVTCYYAAKVDMGDRDLYQAEIDSDNPYNTRVYSSAGKLPVGPICNPSKDAIEAAINYIPNSYYYFVSDKNSKIYFSETESEHVSTINKLKNDGLWFVY